jgi:hypothetical protein
MYSRLLCNLSVEETDEHHFLHCEFAKACWSLLGLVVPPSLDPFQIMKHFMEIIIPLCWSLWSVRSIFSEQKNPQEINASSFSRMSFAWLS